MYTKITTGSLRKADIIVSTGNAGISKAIRAAIGTDVSHSLLWVGNDHVIEAIDIGVIERPWSESSADMTLAIALRRRNMTDSSRDEVVNNARSFAGLPYDKIGAAGSGMYKKRGAAMSAGLILGGCVVSPVSCSTLLGGKAVSDAAIANNAKDSNKDKAFFCSELIGRAFQMAGKPLSDGVEPTFMNPREVRMSSKLIYLGHLIS